MILETAEKKIVFRADVMSDGWGDFADFALTMAREHSIPYEIQQIKSVKRMGRSKRG
ncbi:MAG: hypothetical protein ACLT46_11360 [Hungatella sp.]